MIYTAIADITPTAATAGVNEVATVLRLLNT